MDKMLLFLFVRRVSILAGRLFLLVPLWGPFLMLDPELSFYWPEKGYTDLSFGDSISPFRFPAVFPSSPEGYFLFGSALGSLFNAGSWSALSGAKKWPHVLVFRGRYFPIWGFQVCFATSLEGYFSALGSLFNVGS